MNLIDEKKELKAPEDLIKFIVDTRDGKFKGPDVRIDMQAVRLPNYYYPMNPIYLHGIR